ncbi:DsbA family oxidoreductase [Brevibacillus laterosporus]|nr:DsbA family oxidoreductase [Brevibacillus laterosporus]TPG85654.1 DsbA family oxidoreductase [Brevibacillus laterosporus]
MTVKIKVYSDYVCPFCFLAKAPFEEAIEGKDVEVEWMPFELRPSPSLQLDPWNDPSKLSGWNSFIAPTAEKWGVNMKLPHMSPHPYTHVAFEGYHFAKEQGMGTEYNNRVFKAFFQEEQNIGEIEVLVKLAGEIGLDEEGFKEALVTRKYKEVQEKARQHADEEAQIMAVPTFVIGEERLQGAVSKEMFEKVLAQELGKAGASSPNGMQCDSNESC